VSREVEKLGKRIAFLEETLNSLLRNGTGLGHSSFEDGAIEQYTDGVLGSQFGTQFDGTNGVFSVNGPVPPTPAFTSNSGDPVSAVIGGLLIRWEGFFEGGDTVVAPMDFSHVEIYASDTNAPSLLYTHLKQVIPTSRRRGAHLPARQRQRLLRLAGDSQPHGAVPAPSPRARAVLPAEDPRGGSRLLHRRPGWLRDLLGPSRPPPISSATCG
jgi:hypothetical protein